MNPLYYQIFDKCFKDIPELGETEERLSKQIEIILVPFRKELTTEEFEKVSEMVFEVLTIVEREGFALGLNYIMTLQEK